MRLFVVIIVVLFGAMLAENKQVDSPISAPVVGSGLSEQAIGNYWREWREERQLAREERIQAAGRFEDVMLMLRRLFWCLFALSVLTLVAVILYLAKPAFQLVQSIANQLLTAILVLLIVGASVTALAEQTPAGSVGPNGQAIGPKPASKPPEKSVMRPKLGASYAAALEGYRKHGRPLLVIVSADWCVPCQRMKAELQGHIDAGVLDGVELAVVDWDKRQSIARQVAGDRPMLPTVRLYWVDDGVKRSRRHVGYVGREGLKRLIESR